MQVHKYILLARQTIPRSTLLTAMARHHSFTSSQSEIKSTPTLPSHHPPNPIQITAAASSTTTTSRARWLFRSPRVQASKEQCGWSLSQYCGTARSCSRQLVAAAQSRGRRCTTAAATVAATTGFQTATQGARLFRRIPFCQKRLVSTVLPELLVRSTLLSNHLFRLRCIHVDGAPFCILPGEAQ